MNALLVLLVVAGALAAGWLITRSARCAAAFIAAGLVVIGCMEIRGGAVFASVLLFAEAAFAGWLAVASDRLRVIPEASDDAREVSP